MVIHIIEPATCLPMATIPLIGLGYVAILAVIVLFATGCRIANR